ncbi:hypothetical protein I4U23_003161 [Adineta vaga]|nr:hypothetical protein I4U23_003161 [Adineta vaga]
MEVSFLWIICIITIINECSARYYSGTYSSGSFSSSRLLLGLVISFITIAIIIAIILTVCRIKGTKRARMGVLPLTTQMSLAEHNNPYAPPVYNYPPPYNQLSVREQLPPSYSSMGFRKDSPMPLVTS